MTIGELATLLSHTGLPPTTPLSVRILDGGTEITVGLAVSRVQVIRQLRLGAGQPPEFALEIVVTRSAVPRL